MKALNIKTLVQGVLEKRKNSNDLVLIIDHINVESKSALALEAISGCQAIFINLFESGNICIQEENFQNETMAQKYKIWAKERWTDYFTALLSCLSHEDQCVRKNALEAAVIMLQYLTYFMNTESSAKDNFIFAETELKELIKTLIFQNENFEELVNLSKQCMLKYDDVRYFVMKNIPSIIAFGGDSNSTNRFLHFLEVVITEMPKDEKTDVDSLSLVLESTSFPIPDEKRLKLLSDAPFQLSQQRKRFGQMWLEFLKLPLLGSQVKRVLVIFHTGLVPNFSQPRLLADFLINTFNRGGGLALLALHGLFVLMHHHNLNYPDFYKNLYSMIHPRIFSTKYKARFFHLLDLFLSSTYIPAYMIAAFVKKLSRLSIAAPPHCIETMVGLIMNLLRRHPSIRHMIHCSDKAHADQEIVSDPYIENEPDPALCKAVDSSLWELKALKHHYCPKIAKQASLKSLGTKETDIHEHLEDDYKDFFDEAVEKEFKEFPLNHVHPKTMFRSYEDVTYNLWGGI